MSIRGLTVEESDKLRLAIKQSESGKEKQPYSAVNQLGFVGAYQFGTMALKDLGLIKSTASNANSALTNPNNWVGGMTLQKFFADSALQDQLFERYANLNYSRLSSKGVITSTTTSATIAGYLAVAHLLGSNGAYNYSKGKNGADANGTTAEKYFKIGANAVGGSATAPTPGGTTTPPGTNTGNQKPVSPTIPTNTATQVTIDANNVRPNILGRFASYNPIFTLSVISINALNNATYKENKREYGKIIARSGGGYADNRVETANTSWYNPSGKFDFYIDNVVISSLISYDSANLGSNAIKVSFDVIEPLSMGIFLQSLELAAYPEFKDFKDAPLLLSLEFTGFDQDGNMIPIDDDLDRHFPIRIVGIELTVSGGKSVYSITAIPYNEQALTDQNAKFKEDVIITGSTVAELLSEGPNCLANVINKKLREVAKDSKNTTGLANMVAIGFPRIVYDDTAPIPTDVNEIGKSSMGFDLSTGGECGMPADNVVYGSVNAPPNRASIIYDSTSRSFRFPQGTSILQAITSVILMSKYCKENALKSQGSIPGMKKWFRVETRCMVLNDDAYGTGTVPKLMTYDIVPYEVHEHRIAPPNNIPTGYNRLVKEVIKSYSYVYTGQNTEVIRFDLKYNAIAFTTIYADKNAYNKNAYNQIGSQGVGEKSTPTEQTSESKADIKDTPGAVARGSMYERRVYDGGPPDDYKTLVAKNFHDALLRSPIEQVGVDLEINGDPYFLSDTGLGNYTDPTISFNLTKNGSMNYRNSEVDILIIYRSPNDIDPSTGIMDFGKLELSKTFTGLYQVLQVDSTFRNGKFTQVLKCIRRPMQQIDEILTPKDPDPGLSLPAITYTQVGVVNKEVPGQWV